jgi:hypothetical protein
MGMKLGQIVIVVALIRTAGETIVDAQTDSGAQQPTASSCRPPRSTPLLQAPKSQ